MVGLDGNDHLEHTARDSLVAAAHTTPCIAPYKRANPDRDGTVPRCHEINNDHLVALEDTGGESRTLHARAFVKQNGAAHPRPRTAQNRPRIR